MSRERQLAVYAAEDAALEGHGRVFSGRAEAQRYVDALVATDWWADRWPRVDRVVVGRSRSRRFAGYALTPSGPPHLAAVTPEIRLAAWHEGVLLHEVAHVVAADPTDGYGDDHGDAFVSALLQLVRRQMGFHAYGALRSELGRRGAGGASLDGSDTHLSQ